LPVEPGQLAEERCNPVDTQTKLHQFDTPPSRPGQAPLGAGALWGVGQAMRNRRAATIRREEQELQAAEASVLAISSERERLKADLSALQQIRNKYVFQPLDEVPPEVVKIFNTYRKDVCKINQKWLPGEDISVLVSDFSGFPTTCREIQKIK